MVNEPCVIDSKALHGQPRAVFLDIAQASLSFVYFL